MLYHQDFGFDPSSTIHVNTVHNYLRSFDYKFSHIKKEVYVDDYEWKDIVEYWMEFLCKRSELEKLMLVFDSDNMEIEI